MRYCPKHETWIHTDSCEETKECYDLVDWASCSLLKRKVEKLNEFLTNKKSFLTIAKCKCEKTFIFPPDATIREKVEILQKHLEEKHGVGQDQIPKKLVVEGEK